MNLAGLLHGHASGNNSYWCLLLERNTPSAVSISEAAVMAQLWYWDNRLQCSQLESGTDGTHFRS